MTDMFIPDPNAPQRAPDGQVGEFYFWLGSDEEVQNADELGDVDDDTFGYNGYEPIFDFGDDGIDD